MILREARQPFRNSVRLGGFRDRSRGWGRQMGSVRSPLNHDGINRGFVSRFIGEGRTPVIRVPLSRAGTSSNSVLHTGRRQIHRRVPSVMRHGSLTGRRGQHAHRTHSVQHLQQTGSVVNQPMSGSSGQKVIVDQSAQTSTKHFVTQPVVQSIQKSTVPASPTGSGTALHQSGTLVSSAATGIPTGASSHHVSQSKVSVKVEPTLEEDLQLINTVSALLKAAGSPIQISVPNRAVVPAAFPVQSQFGVAAHSPGLIPFGGMMNPWMGAHLGPTHLQELMFGDTTDPPDIVPTTTVAPNVTVANNSEPILNVSKVTVAAKVAEHKQIPAPQAADVTPIPTTPVPNSEAQAETVQMTTEITPPKPDVNVEVNINEKRPILIVEPLPDALKSTFNANDAQTKHTENGGETNIVVETVNLVENVDAQNVSVDKTVDALINITEQTPRDGITMKPEIIVTGNEVSATKVDGVNLINIISDALKKVSYPASLHKALMGELSTVLLNEKNGINIQVVHDTTATVKLEPDAMISKTAAEEVKAIQVPSDVIINATEITEPTLVVNNETMPASETSVMNNETKVVVTESPIDLDVRTDRLPTAADLGVIIPELHTTPAPKLPINVVTKVLPLKDITRERIAILVKKTLRKKFAKSTNTDKAQEYSPNYTIHEQNNNTITPIVKVITHESFAKANSNRKADVNPADVEKSETKPIDLVIKDINHKQVEISDKAPSKVYVSVDHKKILPKVVDIKADQAIVKPKADNLNSDLANIEPKVTDINLEHIVIEPKAVDLTIDKVIVKAKAADLNVNLAKPQPKLTDVNQEHVTGDGINVQPKTNVGVQPKQVNLNIDKVKIEPKMIGLNIEQVSTEPKIVDLNIDQAKREPKVVNINIDQVKTEPKIVDLNIDQVKAEPKIVDLNTDQVKTKPKIVDLNIDQVKAEPNIVDLNIDQVKTKPNIVDLHIDQVKSSSKTVNINIDPVKTKPKIVDLNIEQVKIEPKTVDLNIEQVKTEPKIVDLNIDQVKTEPKIVDLNIDQVKTEPKIVDLNIDQVKTEPKIVDLNIDQVNTEPRIVDLNKQKVMPESKIVDVNIDQVNAEPNVLNLNTQHAKLEPKIIDSSSIDQPIIGPNIIYLNQKHAKTKPTTGESTLKDIKTESKMADLNINQTLVEPKLVEINIDNTKVESKPAYQSLADVGLLTKPDDLPIDTTKAEPIRINLNMNQTKKQPKVAGLKIDLRKFETQPSDIKADQSSIQPSSVNLSAEYGGAQVQTVDSTKKTIPKPAFEIVLESLATKDGGGVEFLSRTIPAVDLAVVNELTSRPTLSGVINPSVKKQPIKPDTARDQPTPEVIPNAGEPVSENIDIKQAETINKTTEAHNNSTNTTTELNGIIANIPKDSILNQIDILSLAKELSLMSNGTDITSHLKDPLFVKVLEDIVSQTLSGNGIGPKNGKDKHSKSTTTEVPSISTTAIAFTTEEFELELEDMTTTAATMPNTTLFDAPTTASTV